MAEHVLLVAFSCSSTKHPAVARFEWVGDGWSLTGASRQRPGSVIPKADGQSPRKGSFSISDDYPGCPTCGADEFVSCGECSALGCWDTTWPVFTCPSCGNSGEVSGEIDSLTGLGGG